MILNYIKDIRTDTFLLIHIHKLLIEPGDSTKSDNKQKESDKTPCSTVPAKRSAENVGGDDFENVYGDLPSSITRPKAEKMDEVDY